MLKRTIVFISLLAMIAVFPVIAQQDSGAKPGVFALRIGLPIGYDLNSEDMTTGLNFGIDFAVLDQLAVGYDYMSVNGDTANLLRFSYTLLTQPAGCVGMAFGIGSVDNGSPETGMSIGAFWTPFQHRSAQGLAYGLNMRFDYIAQATNFGDGKILFTLGTYFGY